MIQKLKSIALPKEFDYCIIGKVERSEFSVNSPIDGFFGVRSTTKIYFEGGANCLFHNLNRLAPFDYGDTIKVVYFKGEVTLTNLSNPPSGDNQPEK